MDAKDAKVTIPALQQMKRDGRKIVGVVAWDYQIARAGIPVFAQLGITPQTALRYGVEYGAMSRPGAEVPVELTGDLIAEAKRLEEAGACLLDFTNSGPIVGPEVTRAVSIPVLGGFGGGPWLDGR